MLLVRFQGFTSIQKLKIRSYQYWIGYGGKTANIKVGVPNFYTLVRHVMCLKKRNTFATGILKLRMKKYLISWISRLLLSHLLVMISWLVIWLSASLQLHNAHWLIFSIYVKVLDLSCSFLLVILIDLYTILKPTINIQLFFGSFTYTENRTVKFALSEVNCPKRASVRTTPVSRWRYASKLCFCSSLRIFRGY